MVGATLPLWIPASARMTNSVAEDNYPVLRDMLSYQSSMPAAAGTPEYEKPELWLGTGNWHRGFCHATPRPLRGTSPRATFPPPHPWTSVLYRGTGVRQPGCPG